MTTEVRAPKERVEVGILVRPAWSGSSSCGCSPATRGSRRRGWGQRALGGPHYQEAMKWRLSTPPPTPPSA